MVKANAVNIKITSSCASNVLHDDRPRHCVTLGQILFDMRPQQISDAMFADGRVDISPNFVHSALTLLSDSEKSKSEPTTAIVAGVEDRYWSRYSSCVALHP
jgi:hypothetical protein